MFDIDLLIAFFFMSLLFLRQIAILKQPNKINYAPLMLSIGAISSVVHFVLHPDTANTILLIRESLLPMLSALILYLIMNILHQTQTSLNAKVQEEFVQAIASELTQLKTFILELEERMKKTQLLSLESQEDIRKNFVNDIQALDTIIENQNRFQNHFEEMKQWHQDVNTAFKYFSEVQLPELDEVVHKHIDILRVSEQDHYNKLSSLLQSAVQTRCEITEDLEELKTKIASIQSASDEIAQNITQKTVEKLTHVTKAFESEIILLKSHTEALKTSLNEGESTLSSIKVQSEMIMKQMVLSAKKMDELSEKNTQAYALLQNVDTLAHEIEKIEHNYKQAQVELSQLLSTLENNKNEEIKNMKASIDELSSELSKKVDASLEKLHEHYHITSEDISESVKVLAKKAQLQKGYGES